MTAGAQDIVGYAYVEEGLHQGGSILEHIIQFAAGVLSAEVVPDTGSQSVGACAVIVDQSNGFFRMALSIQGVEHSRFTAAHIHVGPRGSNGPVILDLGGPADWVDLDGIGIARSVTNVTFPGAYIQDLISGNTYVDIHTIQFPDGEIRGQISPATICPTCLRIVENPVDLTAAPGSSASFSVTAAGSGPITYQWRKDGSDLANGGSISGVTSSTLTINPVGAADVGSYDVVVTDGTRSCTSDAAMLTVVSCERGDANGDGLVNNFDIDPFVLALTGGQAAWEAQFCCDFLCANDVNRDGAVNNFDIDPFVLCLTGGCP